MMNGARGFTRAATALFIAAVMATASCTKVESSMQGINPDYVAHQFFETWKKQDWKALYRMTHPAFMQKLRLQKLPPEVSALSDEALFVREFQRVQGSMPGRTLRSYTIESITEYHAGAPTVWVSVLVNGKRKKVPLTLDGLVLKVDLSRIE